MEAPQQPAASNERIDQPLSYPNPSLGDTAGFAAANSSPPQVQSGPQRKPRLSDKVHGVLLVFSILLGLFISTLDTSVIATSLMSISEEFQDHANASWILLAYLLTYMGCSVGVSKLSDIYGRKLILFVSWTIFLLCSTGCTAAWSMTSLIIFRALKGIGGAGLYSLAQICLLEHGPAKNPSHMGALIGITLALAFLLGPVLGGAITSKVSWRWIFGINLPIGLFASTCIMLFFPAERRAHHIFSLRAFMRVDLIGMMSLLVASITLVFAIERGGSRVYEWNSVQIIAAFCASGFCWIIFVGWETFLNKKYCEHHNHIRCVHMEPVFTAALAHRRPYICGLIVAFLTGAPYVVLTVAIPERMQVLQHATPLSAGVHLLPMLSGTAVGSFLAGAICRKFNHTSYLMVAASITQLLGIGLMLSLANVDSSFVPAYGFTLIVGLGVGVSFGASTIVAAVEEDKAVAQGLIAQARVLGSCIGVAVCTVLFHNRIDSLVHILNSSQLDTMHSTPTASVHFTPELQRRIQEVYAVAFKDQIIFLTSVCGAMLLAAICSFEKKPRSINALADAQRAFKTSQQEDRDGTELSDMGSVRTARAGCSNPA
ncbi:Multidrug resistance protein 3 [Colletotrichum sp. SAR 10_65]|nr:Multidrug resistance protein 3 [Colletotrichum sp. SAR 10_65]KAI8246046.1 Multidrug resistance protein 3 [Colletotrichum sp. SAR 10_77]